MENIEIRKAKKLKDLVWKFDIAFKTTEFGVIVIKGFRVGQTQFKDEMAWVQTPYYQVFGRYFEVLFLENREIWDEIKRLLTDEYLRLVSGGDNLIERAKGDETINPDDIPI